jgi:hypothetical protein
LELLSRRELPSLAREAEGFTQSGRLNLSGADRLVMIEKSGDSRAVRVVDCATGAVLHEGMLPPKLDVVALSDLLALRLPRYLQSPPKAGARRVALLGFRFAAGSEENRFVESRLNLACSVALQGSGEAVRQRAKAMFRSNLDIYLTNYAGYRCATPEETIAEYRDALRRDFP